MAQFTVNVERFDPYKNFKFRVKWAGNYVAGISRVTGLLRTTEVVEHREGGDPSTTRKSPGITKFAPITLGRGVTHDSAFEDWANKVWPTPLCEPSRAGQFRQHPTCLPERPTLAQRA